MQNQSVFVTIHQPVSVYRFEIYSTIEIQIPTMQLRIDCTTLVKI